MLAHLILAAALAAPAPTPSPGEIYRSALQHLTTLPQPAYIDTVQHWNTIATTDREQLPFAGDERIIFDSTTRRECVLTVPYNSRSRVLISDSYFAPDVWLIHHAAARPVPQGQSNFSPDLSDLKTILSVVSVAKPSYDVRLAGIDAVRNGGGSAYHLVLRPLGDPVKQSS